MMQSKCMMTPGSMSAALQDWLSLRRSALQLLRQLRRLLHLRSLARSAAALQVTAALSQDQWKSAQHGVCDLCKSRFSEKGVLMCTWVVANKALPHSSKRILQRLFLYVRCAFCLLITPLKCALLPKLAADETPKGLFLEKPSPLSFAKAIKNEAELAGMREAHLRDAVALVETLHHLEQEAGPSPMHIPILSELSQACSSREIWQLRALEALLLHKQLSQGSFRAGNLSTERIVHRSAVLAFRGAPSCVGSRWQDTERGGCGHILDRQAGSPGGLHRALLSHDRWVWAPRRHHPLPGRA